MHAEQLAVWLEHHLPGHLHGRFNLRDLRVAHVLNWGGFVNHSFSVVQGSSKFHLKITNDRDSIASLQRWREVHGLLETRFRSPKIVEWVELPEIGFAGLLFEHLDGRTATFDGNPSLVAQLIGLADGLHNDEDIRRHLIDSGSKTYCDYFVETYIDRFDADLEAVSAKPPAFVSTALLAWMKSETAQLAETVGRPAGIPGSRD